MLPRIVIVGAGFGGLQVAQKLDTRRAAVTVVDRTNHHLFQPLLYQVASAMLSPSDIALPIRSVLRSRANTTVFLGEVVGIDTYHKQVTFNDHTIGFDYLVLAVGSSYNYFGHPEWEKYAPSLKTLADATLVRQRILSAFEKAEMEDNPQHRDVLMSFVIIGGGPTGVEMAGAIAELSHRALSSDFQRIDPKSARIFLLEASSRILALFPEKLARAAHRALQRLGVNVMTNCRVNQIDETGVTAESGRIDAHTVVWAAGVRANPVGHWLGKETDSMGRVKVEKDLSVSNLPDIFVIGDAACVVGSDQNTLPALAPVALQEGRFVADVINARLLGKTEPVWFKYKSKGSLATVGRSFAVADLSTVRLSGFVAWVAWVTVHVYYLIGFRNRLVVLFEWAWAYITFQRGARLILPPCGRRNNMANF